MRVSPKRGWCWTFAAVLSVLGGCDEAAAPAARARREAGRPAGGEVVAVVNGVSIERGDVERVAREASLPPRAAADALVDEALLAEEAERLGYGARPAVREAMRRASVRALLEREITARHRPSDIPETRLREAYDARMKKAPPPRPSFEEVRHVIAEQLATHDRGEALTAFVAALEASVGVARDEEAIGRALGRVGRDGDHASP